MTAVRDAAPIVRWPATSLARRGFYYGWVMVPVTIGGMVATSPAQTFGVAAFNEPIRTGLGLSHGELAGAYMLGTFCAALPLPYAGRLVDRFGLRTMTTAAVVLLGLACGVAALSAGLVSLFVAFFLLRFLGPGLLSLVSSSTLAFWFDRHLGVVEGVRNIGMAGAVAVVPAVNLWLIDRLGWRAAFAALGLIVWATMLPVIALLFRNRPGDVGQTIDGGTADAAATGAESPPADGFTYAEARRTRSFWIVLGVNAFWAMAGTAVTFHVVPLLGAHGLGEADAAIMLAALAGSLAVMNIVGGVLADHCPVRYLLAAGAGFMTATLVLVQAPPGVWGVVGVGAAMGAAQGLSTGITSVVCVRYFGRSHLGQIRGAFAMAMIAASSVGPFLVGLGYDVFGRYDDVLTAFAGLAGLGVAAAFFAPPPRRPLFAPATDG